MRFNFIYKKKNFNIDVEVCDNIFSQARGLMFKKNSKPLLFIFNNKKRRAIHSFFCKPFVAIWFDNNKIIDVRLIKCWRLSIKPKGRFNKLLEISSSHPAFKDFLDGSRNI